jgi:hypothetical protein
MDESVLTLWIPVWGEKHLDLLARYTLPSLMAPENLPALKLRKIYAVICGLCHEAELAAAIVEASLAPLPVEVTTVCSGDVRDPRHGLIETIQLCLQRGSRMLLTMPDTVYGGGSVTNLMRAAAGTPLTIAAAHVRVNEDVWFREFGPRLWHDNRSLVQAAWSIGACGPCDTTRENVCWAGGIGWASVNPDTRLLIHYLPTPYLCWWTDFDLGWWHQQPTFGCIDHVWPQHLIAQHRFAVAGSSDLFFAVELESAFRSGSLAPAPGSANQEIYHHRRPNNDVCGCFLLEIKG